MAEMTVSLVIAGDADSKTINATDGRAAQFMDDLRNIHYPEIDDGAGGTRVMTRQEAREKWLLDLAIGQVRFAKALRQRALDALVAEADDLEGNV